MPEITDDAEWYRKEWEVMYDENDVLIVEDPRYNSPRSYGIVCKVFVKGKEVHQVTYIE